MKAVEIVEPGRAELIEIGCPEPAAGEVLVSVSATGVCGSDISAFAGTHPFRIPPVISGHEVSGIVREVGVGVTGVAEGDYVVVEPQLSCNECEYCLSGNCNSNRTSECRPLGGSTTQSK
jgi:L-iditol 2-dehydrogenase